MIDNLLIVNKRLGMWQSDYFTEYEISETKLVPIGSRFEVFLIAFVVKALAYQRNTYFYFIITFTHSVTLLT